MKITRRAFIQGSAATTVVALTSGAAHQVGAAVDSLSFAPGPGNKWPGRVAINLIQRSLLR
mgnify:CR=1 FL=1